MIINNNVLNILPTIKECSQNLIFSDPPYNLGSKWEIKDDNSVNVKGKSVDFMKNKWEGLTGEDIEKMFNEFHRVLKYGGFCCLWSLQRQHLPFLYYANKAGFEQLESINSFFISSFPKALDVSKFLIKYYGDEGTIVGEKNYNAGWHKDHLQNDDSWTGSDDKGKNIISANNPIAKKYYGYKSSICPLKQVNETLLVFRKPFKYKTIVQDIVSKEENNEKDIHGCGVNIDGERVIISNLENEPGYRPNALNHNKSLGSDLLKGLKRDSIKSTSDLGYHNSLGRYPSNLYLVDGFNYTKKQIEDIVYNDKYYILENIGMNIEPLQYMNSDKEVEYICNWLDKFEVSKVLDEQSGNLKSGDNCVRTKTGNGYNGGFGKKGDKQITYADEGGCSRVLHKCKYELNEFDIYNYTTKVNRHERNAGCENLEDKKRFGEGNYSQSPVCSICEKTINGLNNHTECEKDTNYKVEYRIKEKNKVLKNNHPTLKSMKLNRHLINLFITPDIEDFKILIPFSGVNSEYISAMSLGIPEDNIIGIEISEEYIEIGESRKEYWIKNDYYFKLDKKTNKK